MDAEKKEKLSKLVECLKKEVVQFYNTMEDESKRLAAKARRLRQEIEER